jgi:hypothetical protein
MALSKAQTVGEYLRELDSERRAVVSKVRQVVNDHLPDGYEEGMGFGMINWHIPLSTHAGTSNGQPLSYVALAAQKNYNALYLMGVYIDGANARFLRDAFETRGLKFDMGKSCLRFKQIEDLPLDAIGQVIAKVPPEAMMAAYDAAHAGKPRQRAGVTKRSAGSRAGARTKRARA